MVLIILLVISIISQFFAAIVAIRLTRTTKYNAAWILITIALVLTCAIMIGQFLSVLSRFTTREITIEFSENFSIILSVLVSLCFAVGVFLIKKMLSYIATQEEHRRKSDERILSAIIKAEEAQRQLFAKDLHDGLGPLLSTAKLSMSALNNKVTNEIDKEILRNAEQAVDHSIRSIKDISNNISPHVLNNFGVVRALNSFINRVRPAVATKIVFDTNIKAERFVAETEIVIYRVVCELINNVLKHAQASILIVSVFFENNMVMIEVKDDGRGFDTRKSSEGMGLSNISSRVGSVKGTINIKSHQKGGTDVLITLPALPSK